MEPLHELAREYRETVSLERRQELAEQIFGAVYGPLQMFIHRRCPPQAVKDVLQNTVLGMTQSLHYFRGTTRNAFWEWCYRIARNKLADRARKGEDRMVPTDPDSLWKAVEASAEQRPFEPGERLDLEETMAVLRQVQPPCFDYLVEFYFHGSTIAELALEEKVSYDAMRMRFNRCLELVQRLATERNREVSDGD